MIYLLLATTFPVNYVNNRRKSENHNILRQLNFVMFTIIGVVYFIPKRNKLRFALFFNNFRLMAVVETSMEYRDLPLLCIMCVRI